MKFILTFTLSKLLAYLVLLIGSAYHREHIIAENVELYLLNIMGLDIDSYHNTLKCIETKDMLVKFQPLLHG